MTTSHVSGKRKYFARSEEGAPAALHKVFLLRYWKKDIQTVCNDGPYADEKEAHKVLAEYLKKGICSWVVTYNG